jgi:hypothetical protein
VFELQEIKESGRRDSNPRHSAWKGDSAGKMREDAGSEMPVKWTFTSRIFPVGLGLMFGRCSAEAVRAPLPLPARTAVRQRENGSRHGVWARTVPPWIGIVNWPALVALLEKESPGAKGLPGPCPVFLAARIRRGRCRASSSRRSADARSKKRSRTTANASQMAAVFHESSNSSAALYVRWATARPTL